MIEVKSPPATFRGTASRLAGLGVLAALALHGVSVLGPHCQQDLGLGDGFHHHLPLLVPDLPGGDVPVLVRVGLVDEPELPAAVSTTPSARSSRGPPA